MDICWLYKEGVGQVFKDEEIDWSSGEDFYIVSGEYTNMIRDLSDSVLILPMVFEFGTMNSQEMFGSLKSLHILIMENQGANFGYKKQSFHNKVEQDMMELYFPSSLAWRSESIRISDEMFDDVLENLKNF